MTFLLSCACGWFKVETMLVRTAFLLYSGDLSDVMLLPIFGIHCFRTKTQILATESLRRVDISDRRRQSFQNETAKRLDVHVVRHGR